MTQQRPERRAWNTNFPDAVKVIIAVIGLITAGVIGVYTIYENLHDKDTSMQISVALQAQQIAAIQSQLLAVSRQHDTMLAEITQMRREGDAERLALRTQVDNLMALTVSLDRHLRSQARARR